MGVIIEIKFEQVRLTLGKPGAIIGQVTFPKHLASELILASQKSQVMLSASNVDAVLAAAPLLEKDVYEGPKKRRGRPGKELAVAGSGVSVDENVNVYKVYNT